MSTQENDASAVPVKIERLRNKLLDLSYRNPLLSTRLDSARNSYIRVVDELPDFLFSHLHQEGEFMFKPLPPLPLEENPQDEEGAEFQERLAEAHVNDTDYISEIEEIDPSDKDAFAREQDAERSLRDRIRAELGMSRRKTVDHSLAEHAREHGISPGYDLPSQNEKAEHGDDFIQTLLLPDNLERTAGRLIRKNREWQNETGINVMHAAFGFLEWKDPARDKNTLSPLVLLPVRIEEKRTERGIEFRAKGIEESSEANSALAEKLRRDFGIELPRYESNHSIEDYMDAVARMSVVSIAHWRVRRYIAFGVFPSAGLVMYNDLDTAKGNFSDEIVSRVLGENQDVKAALFQADDYDVDNPSVESKVSMLLDRADSSQFSTMVEIANNRDLAVEGPPGTGKSQTIVNVIGAALADGKKVLFVAEKMAALEVVQSRLKHLGMEEFTLPLQPKRSSLRQVLESLRKRIAATAQDSDEDYEKKRLEFRKVRDDIAGYISLISREYGNTHLTIHEIIGLAIRTQELLNSLPRDITNLELDFPVDRDRISRIGEIAKRLEEDWKSVKNAPSVWSGLNVSTRDKFTLDDIRSRIADISALYGEMDTLGRRLSELGLREEADESAPLPANQLKALGGIGPAAELYSLARDVREMGTLKELLASQRELDHLRSRMKTLLKEPFGELLPARLCEIRETIREAGKEWGGRSPTLGELRKNQETLLREQEKRERVIGALAEKVPSIRKWRVKTLMSATRILGETNEAVLSLRNSAASDPKERLLIEKDLQTGSELLGEREQLGEFFHMEKVSDADEISELAATLRSGGFFSFLSSKYRAAKRRYITLSKETGFQKERAVERTVRLAQWAGRKKKFLETQRLKAAFGEYFRGIDTDFETLGELLSYYGRVEKEIGYSANRETRDFLFESPTDLLRFVEAEKPEWLADIRDGETTLEEIAREAGRRVAALERRNETIERFGEMSAHLTGGNIWSLAPDDLCRLADVAEKYSSLKKNVEENPLRAALEQRLADAENRSETIEKNLDIADILLGDPRWTEALREIMLRGKLEEAEKCVDEFLGKFGGAAAAARSLKEKTGIEIEGLPRGMDYSQVAEHLSTAARDEEGIAKQANYSATKQEMENEGAGRWIGKLLESETGLLNLAQTLEALIGRALLMKVNREHPEILRDYSGKRLDVLREHLVEADKDLLEVSRLHLRSKLIREAEPPEGNGKGKVSTHTELSLINHEINKKKRHIPLRDLIRRARRALLELKPCWMMSPLAVAQYLERDGEKFDLCIIDEASQMTPENAMGALSRAEQVMVVGDTNQLPPSNFFRKMISDDDIDEDEDVLEESILEMANQAFTKRQLRWHYRSRDDRLIRYSNHAVYDNNLIIFPSPNQRTENGRTGVSLVRIEGNYKSGLNRGEAKAVIEETLRFMAEQPHRSLGVVTMNKKQQEFLEEQFYHILNDNPAAAEYVEHWNSHKDGLESFFIKNLESVQGDERDVIFISTVYGAERPGEKVAQRFGPINGVAGRRRLNVLFTRAKEQMVTFSSMEANDVTAKNPGTEMLRGWLEYCTTGILDSGVVSFGDGEPESGFEAHVGERIKALGCEIEYQVGVGKYRIDIGVRHPDWPHGFLLGVECDGATYHSSRSARERDRYRQEILEGLGWYLHRIWSTNWFNDQHSEIEKLRLRMEETLAEQQRKLEEEKTAVFHLSVPTRTEEDKEEEIAAEGQLKPEEDRSVIVEIGDRVHITDSDSQSRLELLLTDGEDDPANGIVNKEHFLGKALLGSELGEEVEFLEDNRIHLVVVEKIEKGGII